MIRSAQGNLLDADVEAIVKRNPGPSLLIAGALGFLIGRTLRSNN